MDGVAERGITDRSINAYIHYIHTLPTGFTIPIFKKPQQKKVGVINQSCETMVAFTATSRRDELHWQYPLETGAINFITIKCF